MNLPNKLTIFRIILVPLMVIVPFLGLNNEYFGIPLQYLIIDFIFIVASTTDKLDGYLARKNNQVTTFGKFLDPLADKILVLAAKFMISGYRLIAVEKGGKVIAASNWGKLKTVTQMLAIILAFVDLNSFGECFKGTLQGGALILNIVVTVMMLIQTLATVVSGIEYMKDAKDLIK